MSSKMPLLLLLCHLQSVFLCQKCLLKEINMKCQQIRYICTPLHVYIIGFVFRYCIVCASGFPYSFCVINTRKKLTCLFSDDMQVSFAFYVLYFTCTYIHMYNELYVCIYKMYAQCSGISE